MVKVSVIVPFYGVEKYIEKCARSLMEQTYPNIEFIFVDDGCRDGSAAVLDSVLKNYPERDVKIIKKENGGLPQARLTGLKASSGEYVLHVDSDDFVEKDMVEALVGKAVETGADVVYCDFSVDKPDGSSKIKEDKLYASGKDYSYDMLCYKAWGYVWNKLTRRSLFTEDLFYPTIGMHEDMVLMCQVLPKAKVIAKVDRALYHYRKSNGGTISSQGKAARDSASARNFLDLFRFWEGKEDIPFADSMPYLYYRIGLTTLKYDRAIIKDYPSVVPIIQGMNSPVLSKLKDKIRFFVMRQRFRRLPAMSSDVLFCIFNYNCNDNSIYWSESFSPWFKTVILDSGSEPPCDHPSAVHLDNVYYSGLMNEAYARAVQGGYKWVVVVTSDLRISKGDVPRLAKSISKMSKAVNVGLYQPANALKGTAHWHSMRQKPYKLRRRCFQEGWFHMVRTDILGKICPVDTSVNKLGWGLDVALSYYCLKEDLLILVDSRIPVEHPGGTGYNRAEAERQMKEWLSLIPDFKDPEEFSLSHDKWKVSFESSRPENRG